MQKEVETIVDDNGIEMLVEYEYDREPDYEEEPGNPNTLIRGMIYTEIKSVELVIAKKGIDITDRLSRKQMDCIKEKLTYNE